MHELKLRLWHWQAPHPEWTLNEPWPREVSSYAIDGTRLLLFYPLAVTTELTAPNREPVVVLTAPWHERDTRTLVERLGAPGYVPPPDTEANLMEKYGDE